MKRPGLTDPPDGLSVDDRAWIRAWALEHEPKSVRRLLELEECCLDHFRANGKRMKDWRLTVKNWIRNEKKFSRTYEPNAPQRPVLVEWSPPVSPEQKSELDQRREIFRRGMTKRP